jgi:hypothetical protein
MFDVLVIALLCLVYAKGKRAVVAYRDREQRWREADAHGRERIVREQCAFRVIGRVIGAAGLGIGAFIVASPALATMWAIVGLRLLMPIKQEMRDACSYRSTGAPDELHDQQ